MLREHPSIPHVWELSNHPAFPAPRIGVIGAIHGNELAGLRAIERVRAEAAEFSRRMNGGTLVMIHGNPRATSDGGRTSRGGVDINRLFSYGFLDELAREAWVYEHHRAAELKPLVQGLDALLDLHSASRPTPPFAICAGTPGGIDLAQSTGCKVTYGWDGPGMLMQHVSIGWMVTHGRPALSVECGQHHEAAAPERAFEVLTRFLGKVGLTDHPPAPDRQASFELFARVVKPTLDFSLAREFESFDVLEPGALLGSGEGVTIHVEREAVLLLPTPKAERGEDIVYLARRVE